MDVRPHDLSDGRWLLRVQRETDSQTLSPGSRSWGTQDSLFCELVCSPESRERVETGRRTHDAERPGLTNRRMLHAATWAERSLRSTENYHRFFQPIPRTPLLHDWRTPGFLGSQERLLGRQSRLGA